MHHSEDPMLAVVTFRRTYGAVRAEENTFRVKVFMGPSWDRGRLGRPRVQSVEGPRTLAMTKHLKGSGILSRMVCSWNLESCQDGLEVLQGFADETFRWRSGFMLKQLGDLERVWAGTLRALGCFRGAPSGRA